MPSPSKSKKRNADDMMDGEGSDGEGEEGDMPPVKKFKVDRYVNASGSAWELKH